MRTRATILTTALTAALLAGSVSPSAAVSEQTAASRAVTGRMIAAPRAEAFVRHVPVRVAVRVPPRTTRLWIRLGGRNITSRFRGAGSSMRVANLTRGDGLRYGANRLVVLAERRGGRPVIHARSFVLARRQHGLVRLGIRPGPVTSLSVRVARNARLAPEHSVHLWLNGRRVTRVLDRSRPTHWTAKLSASHGLRHGVNRLRILVSEADRGRYALLRRRFVVRRERHLAAAGWDIATHVGGRVRLDGRRSRAARDGRPDHSWRILSKPPGSRAVLRRAGAARPLLTPDRRGRYVVGLTVTDRTRRATASQATRSSTDNLTVTVGASSLLLPFKGYTLRGGDTRGIQVGDTFYPSPKPDSMQWLTLNRSTLTPTKTGNSWFDGSGSADHGVAALDSALSKGRLDELVILSGPRFSSGPPVQQAQVAGFNRAMKRIGVGPIDQAILTARGEKLVIVGVPYGGEGSGWYTHGGSVSPDSLTGWLMPEATAEESSGAVRFRLQPERPAFDTSSAQTPTTNTMTLRDRHVDAALPAGATGGFQVAIVDPIDFAIVNQAVFATNGVANPASGLAAMAKFLRDNAGLRYHLAVQSIGRVAPAPEGHLEHLGRGTWFAVGTALAAYAANPHIFNTIDGAYAFLGGSQLEKGEGADSSSAVVIDPGATPAKRETGTLHGRATMRHDGYFTPVVADPSESFDFSLYDKIFSAPTPWPYTKAAGHPEAAAYARALAYITPKLKLLQSYSPDLRRAYVENDNMDWNANKNDLDRVAYPGDGRTCTADAGAPDPTKPAYTPFTREQFCTLVDQLQDEFDALITIETQLFSPYQTVLDRSGGKNKVQLQSIGDAIRTAVAAGNGPEIGWSVGAFMGNLISAGLVLSPSGPLLAAWEALVVVYELVREIVNAESGPPVGDQVTSKVERLSAELATRLADSADALDRLRDVIVSDYGRLQAVSSVATSRGWSIDKPAMASRLETAAKAYFSSELMPIPYGVHALMDDTFPQGFIDAPKCSSRIYGSTWRGVPDSAQLRWMGDFARDGEHGWFPTLFALGRHRLSTTYKPYPPATLTDQMFRPVAQNGYGMQLPRFAWEQYKKGFPPTDIFLCDGTR